MPWNISSVAINNSKTFPYMISALTMTSQGHLAVIEADGPNAAIYSFLLVHMLNLNVVGAMKLWAVTRKENVLFMTDRDSSNFGIHVINETGQYSHKIPLLWQPQGIGTQSNSLYVPAIFENAVYKIDLDQYNLASSIVKITMSDPSALSWPNYLYVHNNKMVVGNFVGNSVTLASLAGDVAWSYGSSGVGVGQFTRPCGISVDNWGRCIVADNGNRRVQLVASNGTFIMYLLSGMEGNPREILVAGNSMFVTQDAPSKIYKYDIN